ncbi:hypothetical protein C0991_005379 [Blastosporella zonata]|nr:hypothetical protein C0991_005379 [Blastosporella zonata]
MALHADAGCAQAANPVQSGKTLEGDCSIPRGCIVAETKSNSFGSGFNSAGGGVFATQIDVTGVYIWFWGRSNIPASITAATSTSSIDTTTFGMPSASYPATGCNFTDFFGPQQLVLLTTLCGDCIIGPGSPTYDEAYWDISYIRTYLVDGSQPLSSTLSLTSTSSALPATSAVVVLPTPKSTTGNATPAPTTGSNTNDNSTAGGQGQGNGALSTDGVTLRNIMGVSLVFYVLSSLI